MNYALIKKPEEIIMNKEKFKFKKITIFHFILIVVAVFCITLMFYWRNKTLIYHCFDINLYINEISEDQIIVKSLPASTEDIFNGEYIIEINDTLIIKDSKGGEIDINSLERGDILLFDYDGPIKFKNKTPIDFKDGTILNSAEMNTHNFRLSDEKLNLKFWHLE
jgi:hypothetical protein